MNSGLTLWQRTSGDVNYLSLEDFCRFLRSHTDIFGEKILITKDNTSHKQKNIISNDIVVLKGDKDSSILVMGKKYYIHKFE